MNFERYIPGGDLYQEILLTYGLGAADRVAQAALAQDPTALNNALSDARRGTTQDNYNGSTSTLENFADQLFTDPFGAPLDSLNTALENTAASFGRNLWVLAAAAGALWWIARKK